MKAVVLDINIAASNFEAYLMVNLKILLTDLITFRN